MSKAMTKSELDNLAAAPLAAQFKTAADYGAPEPDNRSPQEIEADLEQVRRELEATVNELAERLSPAQLAQDAKTKAMKSVQQTGAKLREFADALVNLDPRALKIAGGALLTLLAWKILRK